MELKIERIKEGDRIVMTARWLSDGDENYFTTTDAALLLGVSSSAVRHLITRHKLPFVNDIHETTKKYLRERRVIPPTGRAPNLIPTSTMDELVKRINTPEAMELWDRIMRAMRSPEEYVKWHQELRGQEGVDRIQQALDNSKVTVEQQAEMMTAIEEALLRHSILPSTAVTINGRWYPGTVGSVQKMLAKQFTPESIHTHLSGKDLFGAVLNQKTYPLALAYIREVTWDAKQLSTLRWVEYNNFKMAGSRKRTPIPVHAKTTDLVFASQSIAGSKFELDAIDIGLACVKGTYLKGRYFVKATPAVVKKAIEDGRYIKNRAAITDY